MARQENELSLKILSGGAANGLVDRLRSDFATQTGLEISGDFGAVGGMRDRILNGEAVDVAILTRQVIDGLVEAGKLDPESVTDLGAVETGVAVKTGADTPTIADGDALAQLFGTASSVFCPDTVKATAGIHVADVMARLGLSDKVTLSEFPNGQTAMANMAKSDQPNPVGCTQVTEILNTPGVVLVGVLPAPYDLSTVYTAAIAATSNRKDEARVLIDLLSDPDASELRRSVGFT